MPSLIFYTFSAREGAAYKARLSVTIKRCGEPPQADYTLKQKKHYLKHYLRNAL